MAILGTGIHTLLNIYNIKTINEIVRFFVLVLGCSRTFEICLHLVPVRYGHCSILERLYCNGETNKNGLQMEYGSKLKVVQTFLMGY